MLSFAGYRILVADDNIVNCEIAARLLQKLDCHADIATDAHAALDLHQRHPYDMVLMDCQMPGLDGFQATARIRADEAGRRRTPVIGWSGSIVPDQRSKCVAAGMDELMLKPIRLQVLQNLLAQWLPRDQAKAPLAAGRAQSGDLESMRRLLGPDFAELASLYRSDTSSRLAALHEAAAMEDMSRMTRLAHVLSGSCASIGATRLALLCQDLEARCKAGLPDDWQCKMGAIDTEYARIAAMLLPPQPDPARSH